jgi:uncharacterized protein (TIGR02145 family)
MLRTIYFILYFFFLIQNLNAQQFGTLKDSRDGKVYKTVKIDNEIWMGENLNSLYFQNGDPILLVNTDSAWIEAIKKNLPACMYFENTSINAKKYGLLYNIHAVNDKRKIAPKGWHISTEDEFTNMISFIGGYQKESALKLMSNTIDINIWKQNEVVVNNKGVVVSDGRKTYKKKGENSTGFSALYSGCWIKKFYKNSAIWWLTQNDIASSMWGIHNEMEEISSDTLKEYNPIKLNSRMKEFYAALSVRCIKDKNLVNTVENYCLEYDFFNESQNFLSDYEKNQGYMDLGQWRNNNKFSISMWIMPNKTQTKKSIILASGNNTVQNWSIQSNDNGNSWNWGNFNFKLNSTGWQHLLLTYDNGIRKIYLNGKLHKTWKQIINISGLSYLTLGGSTYGGRFSGSIDELYITKDIQYDDNFTPLHFIRRKSLNTYGLWHFNEGGEFETKEEVSGKYQEFGNWMWGLRNTRSLYSGISSTAVESFLIK